MLYVFCRMVETRTSSKKSGTSSTSPTSDRKLTIPWNELPGSPCSVSKTGRKRVLHAGDNLGVQKLRKEDIISSDKSKPDAEGTNAANETLLKVQISKFALRSKVYG